MNDEIEFMPQLKCRCGFNYEGGQKKQWLVGSCRGCWQCLVCKGMGYCYEHTPDHRSRFARVVRAHPLWLLDAAQKEIERLKIRIKTLEANSVEEGEPTIRYVDQD